MKRLGVPLIMRKRTLLMAALLFVGGAIINVAVAWGLIFCMAPDAEISDVRDLEDSEAAILVRAGFDNKVSPIPDQCNGWEIRRAGWLGTSADWVFDEKAFFSHDDDSIGFLNTQTLRAGWPSLAFWSRSRIDQHMTESHVGGLSVPIALQREPRTNRAPVLPLLPLWPGFAINTIFYAALLWGIWLLFTSPGFVRRRVRIMRHRCPACAYPVGASHVCTECGAAVSVRPKGAQECSHG